MPSSAPWACSAAPGPPQRTKPSWPASAATTLPSPCWCWTRPPAAMPNTSPPPPAARPWPTSTRPWHAARPGCPSAETTRCSDRAAPRAARARRTWPAASVGWGLGLLGGLLAAAPLPPAPPLPAGPAQDEAEHEPELDQAVEARVDHALSRRKRRCSDSAHCWWASPALPCSSLSAPCISLRVSAMARLSITASTSWPLASARRALASSA
mmetsp:Transcript_53731/g.126522  ORF Transcript_53731/g.126522 Transcript_53731/m.126522 type:complete len:211 (-) Transcript_53731:1381-2013(-)